MIKLFITVDPKWVELDKKLSKDCELDEATFETYARYLGCEVKDLKFAGLEEHGDRPGYNELYDSFEDGIELMYQNKELKVKSNMFDNLCYQSIFGYECYDGQRYVEVIDRGYKGWFTK